MGRARAPDINVTVLVDFENDSVETALEVARALGDRLWGVRLDTSETLVDRRSGSEMGYFDPTGVNQRLVEKVRDALDAEGFERVKIVVSGGFDVEKIRPSRSAACRSTPTASARRSSAGENDFTGDVVLTDGQPVGEGRTAATSRTRGSSSSV